MLQYHTAVLPVWVWKRNGVVLLFLVQLANNFWNWYFNQLFKCIVAFAASLMSQSMCRLKWQPFFFTLQLLHGHCSPSSNFICCRSNPFLSSFLPRVIMEIWREQSMAVQKDPTRFWPTLNLGHSTITSTDLQQGGMCLQKTNRHILQLKLFSVASFFICA